MKSQPDYRETAKIARELAFSAPTQDRAELMLLAAADRGGGNSWARSGTAAFAFR